MGASWLSSRTPSTQSQFRHPSGEAAHPSSPTVGAIEIFDPFTEGRGLRRINRLEANAARL
jgi:hypothetical protein